MVNLQQKNKTLFSFNNDAESKKKNASILCQFQLDITKAIQAQSNTLTSFGSKFRSPENLEPLLSLYPNWSELWNILLNGATFPFWPISDDEQKMDILFHFNEVIINLQPKTQKH